VLGPVETCTGDGTVLVPARRRERTLLGVLLLESGRTVTAERLCDLLWNGDPPANAQQSLRTHVARIRALLAKAGADEHHADEHGVALVSDRGGYRLHAPAGTVDAQRFRDLVEAAAAAGDLTERDRLLGEALGLWRGPVLGNAVAAGLRYRLCAELEDLRLRATEELMATGLALGRHRELAPELARLCAEYPVRQRLVALRMLALHRDGRTPEALDAYRQARGRLARELGQEPGPDLQRLHTAILRGEPVAEPEPVPGDDESRPASVTPSQLPAAQATFIGRTGHLRRLNRLLSGRGPVATIAGPAGIGKTSFAVYWAHGVRHRFPDGQLFVNLRGFGPTEAAMAPSAAIRSFLGALGVTADRMPPDLLAQVELYRSLLADKRMLVVLDNARDPEQVRPLLPDAAGCLTVVTSRTRLTGLTATGAAEPLALDLLPVQEARHMLAARLGEDRVHAEPAAVDDIVASCAGLPLALAIAAAHAALQPDQPLAAIAADLRAAHHTLDALATDDVSADVRAVFSWTYRALRPATALLFRLVGLHPGPHLTISGAASAAGVPQADVRPMLTELTRVHLLDETAPGRYGMHDLLRAYAVEQALRQDADADREAALLRIVDHHLQTAFVAATLLDPHRDPVALDPPHPGTTVAELADRDEAVAWLRSERHVLLAVVQHTVDAELSSRTVQLAWCLADFLDRRGHWHDLVDVQAAALDAAGRTGEPAMQALAHRELALALLRLARYEQSEAQLERALATYEALGDRLGQAHTHQNIARLYERQGRNEDGLSHSRQALELYRLAGYRHGEALTLNGIGWRLAQLGDYHEALRHCEQALVLLEELDDQYGVAATWDSIGYTHRQLGHHDEAIACYERAVPLFREVGDRYCEAETVTYVGDLHFDSGAADAAREAWQHALDIFDELGHPDAGAVRDKLHGLNRPT
jgi:DNA-binding SARP family transcriptional activator/Tfp pilus assembly protein PilF